MTDLIKQTIGVAGCGTMGLPMAQQLLTAGYDVWGFDVRPRHEFGDFEKRMIIDADEFSNQMDIVISVVRDHGQTHDLCFDVQGLFHSTNAPDTLIISSTLSPKIMPELRQRLPHHTQLVDAPMSGAPHRARSGELTFMLGGSDYDISRLMPLFNVMGHTVHHLGGVGCGLSCKVANNFVASASVAAVRHVLNTCKTLNLEPEALLEVMNSSSGGTWFGSSFNDIDWASEGYSPTNTMGILEKDMLSFLDAINQDPDQANPLEKSILHTLRNLKPYSN